MDSVIHTSAVEYLNLHPSSDGLKGSQAVEAIVEEITSPKASLGLLDLPREIRDEIYTILFLSENQIIYPSKSRAKYISEATGLLRANSKIYREVVEILYGQNMFQIRGDPAFMAPEFLNLLIFQTRKEG